MTHRSNSASAEPGSATSRRRWAWRIVLASTLPVAAAASAVAPAHAANCHASKNCGDRPPADYCDSGGLAGPTIADQIADNYGGNGGSGSVPSRPLQGMMHDPGVGGFGSASGVVYVDTRSTPAATAGTEAACAINALHLEGL